MPRKALKPCKHPGCPNLTDGLYCAEHHGITADRKTKITEVSTETAEKCTVGCEMQ